MNNKIVIQENNIELMMRRYGDMIFRIAFNYMKNIHDAEDISQDVFIKILKNNKNFIDAEQEKAWVIVLTMNTCKDKLRSSWKKIILLKNNIEFPFKEDNDNNNDIMIKVFKLSKKYRMIIYLYYFEGYKISEISKILKQREGTIKTKLRRAREFLKNEMKGGREDEK
jgi:RNA polymerase sigma-70 factor (ECF subfamily)